jgi:hypothetical protein
LYDHFSGLMQGRRLELAKELGILTDLDRHTLGAIAKVRNSFAHRVENINGSLQTYFETRNQNEKVTLLNNLHQSEGQDKAKESDDLSTVARGFRLQLFVCAMWPLRAIADLGLAADKKAEEDKVWTLNDMYAGKGALGIIASAMRGAGAGAEMYREKIIK